MGQKSTADDLLLQRSVKSGGLKLLILRILVPKKADTQLPVNLHYLLETRTLNIANTVLMFENIINLRPLPRQKYCLLCIKQDN